METLKIIADKITTSDGGEIVYGRRFIKHDFEKDKTDHDRYVEGNITQFYDGWINPEEDSGRGYR